MMDGMEVRLPILLLLQILCVCFAADVWVTHPDQSRLISWDGGRTFVTDAEVTPSTITVDESTTYQTMDGFRAALTDSAAWLIQNKLSSTQHAAVIKSLFGFDDGNAGISYLRIPLGGSDMALSHYTYDDGAADPDLTRFSIAHDLQYIIPIATQAKAIDASLKYMATPWSAPAWMKTSNNLNYGKLNQAYYPNYATYLRKVYDAYKQNGVTFDAMTVQNEPRHDNCSYPCMYYEWYDELNFVRDHLSPRMAATGVKLLTLDHNWDLLWYPKAVMNEGSTFYAGSAWHCYAGSNSAMGEMHNAYPQKDIYFTECSGTFAASNFGDNMKWNMQNLVIGGTKNWAKTVLLWSLALDPSGGIHTAGCADCRGVISIDQNSGQVTYYEEFYSIAHFARFVFPGAVRIGTSDLSDG
ncbi:hypothetical protein M758_11G155600 [Ceratodon purpureus]|nr:hypothetical protein M758_11G155600 [Ceratodon purpureus]